MFGFLSMMDNYEDRKVNRYEADDLVIDTAYVTDGNQSYETGISHPEYNQGDWIIVEAYDNKEDALKGHERWVLRMTSENLPSSLKDCKNSEIANSIDEDVEYPRIITIV